MRVCVLYLLLYLRKKAESYLFMFVKTLKSLYYIIFAINNLNYIINVIKNNEIDNKKATRLISKIVSKKKFQLLLKSQKNV